MVHYTQFTVHNCVQQKKNYLQQIKKNFLGITLFDTFSLLFQKEKNLMPLFLIACNRGLILQIWVIQQHEISTSFMGEITTHVNRSCQNYRN